MKKNRSFFFTSRLGILTWHLILSALFCCVGQTAPQRAVFPAQCIDGSKPAVGSPAKPFRFFFFLENSYTDKQIEEFARLYRGNSDLILGGNPQDKAKYERARKKAQSLGIKWSSNRIGQGMPGSRFPGDTADIDEYTKKMSSMKGLSKSERIKRWVAGAWIGRHREWLAEDSENGVYCTEWDNIHNYNATKLFQDHQAWEKKYQQETGKKITTKIVLKNIYPNSAQELAGAFDKFKRGQPGGLDPSRFCPIPISEEHMSRSDKNKVAQILKPYGLVPGDTLDTDDYRVIPNRQPGGLVGAISGSCPTDPTVNPSAVPIRVPASVRSGNRVAK